jgi:hypothetical protein
MDVSSSKIHPDASFFEGGHRATDLMYVRRMAKEQAAAHAHMAIPDPRRAGSGVGRRVSLGECLTLKKSKASRNSVLINRGSCWKAGSEGGPWALT